MKKQMCTMIGFSRQKQLLLSLVLIVLTSWNTVLAQVSISAHNTDFTTNFNGWNNTLPSGWTRTGANYIGTTSATNGGVYAIPNAGFGYRPSSTAPATSCSVTGSYQNNTGSAITSIEISYQAFQVTAAASRTPNWTVTSTLGNVSALTWVFNAATTPSSPANQTMTLPVNVPAGGTFTITFASDRGAGSGSSPLIGINNVKIRSVVSAATCDFPANLAENNVTDQTADFNWDAVGANTYEYVLSTTAATPAGAGTATTATAFAASGLTPSTNYCFYVRTDCGSGTFSGWTMVNFTTAAPLCPASTGVTASNATDGSADLSWNAQGANGFEYVLDQTVTAPLTAGTATAGTTFHASGLTPATTYYFHVRTDCGSGNFSPWTTTSFTTACPGPSAVIASGVTQSSADLSWNTQGMNNFECVIDQSAQDPSTAGTLITGATFHATGLMASTGYIFHIRTICANGSFSEWQAGHFTTNCEMPAALTVSNTTTESTHIIWNGHPNGTYEYVVSELATNPAGAGTEIQGTEYTVEGLNSGTTYYFFVRANCGDGSFSDWAVIHFSTACNAPTGVVVSGISSSVAVLEWDAQGSNDFEFVLDGTATAPGTNGTPISGIEYHATNLSETTTYYFHIRNVCGAGAFSDWTTISFTTLMAPCAIPTGVAITNITEETADLSWNGQTGVMYEYVLDQSSATPVSGTQTAATSVSLTGLDYLTSYYVHVRTLCANGGVSPWTLFSFTTTAPTNVCAIPSGLEAENITASSVDLFWVIAIGATGYEYAVNTVPTHPSTGTATTSNSISSFGLAPMTQYYLHVRTNCGNGNFSDWTTIPFTTGTPPQCATPTGLSGQNVTDDAADIFWTTQSGVTGYEYVVNEVPSNPQTAGTVNADNTVSVSGLQPSTTYFVHVRANCGNGNYSAWTTLGFATASNVGLTEEQQLIFKAYPNPASGQVTIQTEQSEGTVMLIDLHGQQLRSIDLGETTGMDLLGIESGVYILLYELNGVSSPVRLVVE